MLSKCKSSLLQINIGCVSECLQVWPSSTMNFLTIRHCYFYGSFFYCWYIFARTASLGRHFMSARAVFLTKIYFATDWYKIIFHLLNLLPNLKFYQIPRGFHWGFARGIATTRDVYSSKHLVPYRFSSIAETRRNHHTVKRKPLLQIFVTDNRFCTALRSIPSMYGTMVKYLFVICNFWHVNISIP